MTAPAVTPAVGGTTLGNWTGVLVTEGEMTGDDRFFEPGSIQFDEQYLPFPLRWAPEDFGGHDGAVHVAWIDAITREGNSIKGSGRVFRQEFMDYLDTAGKAGVSVDCDQGTYTVELVEPNAPSIEAVDTPVPGVEYSVPRMIERYQDARLRAATVVDIPAFISAYVTPDGKPMVASGFSGFIEVAEALFDEASEEGRVEATGNLRDDGAVEYALDGTTLARQDLVAPPEDGASPADPGMGLTHAGLALQALDTGRVVMVQRALDATDEAAGKWEFPGGGIDEGEDPWSAATREFGEEVGHELTDGCEAYGTHDFGIYRLHVSPVQHEQDQEIDGRTVANPDGHKEATAWWSIEDIKAHPELIRQEVTDNIDQVKFPTEDKMTTPALAAAPPFPPKKAAAPAAPPAKAPADDASPADEQSAAKAIQQAIDLLGDADPEVVDHLQKALDAVAQDATAEDHLTASAAPVAPPDEWFEPFALDGPTPLTVTASGRVFGHIAEWGACHRSGQYAGKCVSPPDDPKAPFFHLGELITASGATIDVGGITVGGGHFTASGMITTIEHHDDVTSVAAAVRVQQDEFGIGVFGSVTPDATPGQVAALRRSPVSGAWRTEKGKRRLVGIHAVVNPGFPIPRQMMASVTPEEFITFGRVEGRAGDPTAVNLRAAAQRIARSAGLDTQSLVASARSRMSDLDCGCDDEEGD